MKTIIYTHGHPDHLGGAGVFSDTVEEVIAFAPMKPVLLTQGLGPREGIVVGEGKRAFFPPMTVYNQEKVHRMIDGINLEIVPALGETDDPALYLASRPQGALLWR